MKRYNYPLGIYLYPAYLARVFNKNDIKTLLVYAIKSRLLSHIHTHLSTVLSKKLKNKGLNNIIDIICPNIFPTYKKSLIEGLFVFYLLHRIAPTKERSGADTGTRTRISSLAKTCSTLEPYPLLETVHLGLRKSIS